MNCDPNYRILAVGEIIQEGDEGFNSHADAWIPHDRVGNRVMLAGRSRRPVGDPDAHLKQPEEETPDMVNLPPHYQSEKGVECIDAIEAALTPEEFRGYCKGNALKYIWRERGKGGDEDLKKAAWYLNRLTR